MSDRVPAAVFLSYASQDAEAARRICESLRAAGIEVWFDQNELVGGDAWDAKIRRQISACALFVPLISAGTQARLEGYFRLEWKLAAQRTHTMAEEKAFLLPVVLDATHDADAKVPAEFKAVQWTRLPGGETNAAFMARVRQLLGQPAGGPTVPLSPPPAPVPALPRARRPVPASAWAVGAILVAVLGGALLFGLRKAGSSGGDAGPRPPVAEKPSPAAALPGDKSIAVLPFDNLSTDQENGFFADGVHEDLLTALQNIRELRVLSRTTMMQYRERGRKSLPQIARELGVTYILEGSVRRAGNKVRVSAQLIDARTDAHLWALPAGEHDLTDIFAVQARLASAIAAELRAAISPEERKRVEHRPTGDVAAYDLYLKARQQYQQSTSALGSWGTFAPVRRQQALLEAAVALDPKFAEAWAALATAHAIIYFTNVEHTAARLESARTAIERARQLAPDSPEVIRHLGNFHLYGYRDYARATEQLTRLARQRPNDSDVLASLADLQQRQGQWLEAVRSFRQATQLDPGNLAHAKSLKNLLQGLRRWDEAIAEQRRIVALQPENSSEAWRLAYLHFESRGSRREVEEFWRTVPDDKGLSYRRQWAIQSGDFATAIELARRRPQDPSAPDPFTNISDAMTLFASGDQAGARALIALRPEILRHRLQTEPANRDLWWGLGLSEAILGHRAEAVQAGEKLAALIAESRDAVAGAQLRNKLALILAWAGETDRAIALTAEMLAQPFSVTTVALMRHDPWWFPLRGDPRFEALLNDPKNNAPLS